MDSREFSKIIVAVDGSQHSMNAADYAILIATKHGSELILLHVLPVDSSVAGLLSSPSIDQMKKEAQVSFDRVKQKAEEISKDIRLRAELISSLSVVGGIVDFAEKEKIDLIIVGTRGRSGFKKLLLGSVASGVVNYAHCPVLTVK